MPANERASELFRAIVALVDAGDSPAELEKETRAALREDAITETEFDLLDALLELAGEIRGAVEPLL